MRRTLAWLAGSIVLAMVLPAAALGGGKTRTLNFTLSATCANGGSVSYTWSGFTNVGGVYIVVRDVTTSSTVVAQSEPTNASSGTFGPFTFTETNGDSYEAVGALEPASTQNSKRRTLPGSEQRIKGVTATCT